MKLLKHEITNETQVIEILGWYTARSVLLHGEKMSLKPWLAIVLVKVSQKNILWGKCLTTSTSLEPHIFLMGWL